MEMSGDDSGGGGSGAPDFRAAPKSRLYYPRVMDAVATEHKLFFRLGKQD